MTNAYVEHKINSSCALSSFFKLSPYDSGLCLILLVDIHNPDVKRASMATNAVKTAITGAGQAPKRS